MNQIKNFKTLLLASVLASSAILASQAQADTNNSKIGTVDFLTVFQQAPQGNATLDSLKAALKPQVDKLKTEQAALNTQLNTLERNAPTLSADDRKKQEDALAKQQDDFQTQVTALKNDETSKEQTAASAFETALSNAINQVAKSGHYNLILNTQAAPYSDDSMDVTAQVVADMKKAAS